MARVALPTILWLKKRSHVFLPFLSKKQLQSVPQVLLLPLARAIFSPRSSRKVFLGKFPRWFLKGTKSFKKLCDYHKWFLEKNDWIIWGFVRLMTLSWNTWSNLAQASTPDITSIERAASRSKRFEKFWTLTGSLVFLNIYHFISLHRYRNSTIGGSFKASFLGCLTGRAWTPRCCSTGSWGRLLNIDDSR